MVYFSSSVKINRAAIIDQKVIQSVFVLGPEHQEKLKLEEQLRAAEEMLKFRKRQLQELQQDLQVIPFYSQCRAHYNYFLNTKYLIRHLSHNNTPLLVLH